ncbi:MAG: hypothetical protein AAF755_12495 [Pseudomonadota bacterium]
MASVHQAGTDGLWSYQSLARIYTRKQYPRDWAQTQYDIAACEHKIAMHAPNADTRTVLINAIEKVERARDVENAIDPYNISLKMNGLIRNMKRDLEALEQHQH